MPLWAPFGLIAIYILFAFGYAAYYDFWKAVYWASAALLTTAVTMMGKT